MPRPRYTFAAVALLLLGAMAPSLVAQEGVVTYDRATRLALELPPEIQERLGDEIPGERFESLVLLFSPTATVMIPAPDDEGDSDEAPAPGSDAMRQRRIESMVDRMRQSSPERTDQEQLLVAHTDLVKGTVVENRVFMGRTFLIEGERPRVEWRLTGEQTEFAGHMVLKALATVDSTDVEAWFTPQIPVPAGPGGYGGLPGLILSLSIDGGRIVYSATAIRMTPVDEGAIRPPTEGQEIGRTEYERIVEERLEELRMLREDRRRRLRGGR